jgi:phage-related protein
MPSIGQGVREIRIQVQQQYRIVYVAKFDDKVHVLHAFQKKTQKTRQGDIEMAKNRLKAVMKRYRK